MLAISLFTFIVLLGIFVFVHEFGHFIVAKRLGVGVLTFSLGFGPKVIGRKVGETLYKISAFPLGGYVKLIGENPEEKLKQEDKVRSFSHQPVWKRALIICAGPFFNFFFGVAIFFFLNPFTILTAPSISPHPVIAQIVQGEPAEEAGLKSGDIILEINGVTISKWEELSTTIRNSKGKELLLKVKRDEEIIELKVTPMMFKDDGGEVFRIGIMGMDSDQKIGPKFEIGNGFNRTLQFMKLVIIGVEWIISGKTPVRDAVGGPIRIAQLAGEQAKKGLADIVFLLAVISIDLAIVNLLPIPILDGGHLLFLAIEAIRRRPLSIKQKMVAQQIGLIILMLLFAFVFYNDITWHVLKGAKQ
ncbi:MAG: RIP metalloprotease RseP [Deltaproteobacteria bacterium]|nr:RIP metalloprotease RseP [Deltaproteobacteria bacterium]